VGLLALIEGWRAGAKGDDIAKRARKDALHSVAHVAQGPAVNFAAGMITGENAIGMPIGAKAKPGWPNYNSQVVADIQGSLLNLNPVVAAMTGADRPREKNATTEERVMRLFGPFGLKYRSTPAGKPQPSHR